MKSTKQLQKHSICLAGSLVMGLKPFSKAAVARQLRVKAHPSVHIACMPMSVRQLMEARWSSLMCHSLSTCHSSWRSCRVHCSSMTAGQMLPCPLLIRHQGSIRRPSSTPPMQPWLTGKLPWLWSAAAFAASQPQGLGVSWSRRLCNTHR